MNEIPVDEVPQYLPGVSVRRVINGVTDPWEVPVGILSPADEPAKFTEGDLLVVENFLNNTRVTAGKMAAYDGGRFQKALDEFVRVVMPPHRGAMEESVAARRSVLALGDLLQKLIPSKN